MPSLQVESFGTASRALPQAAPDNSNQAIRIGRYQEPYALSLIRKQHLLADEGSYRSCNNNAQSGIAINAIASFNATVGPAAIIYNSDTASNPGYKRIYLDYLLLNTTAAGGAASTLVNLQGAVYLDAGNRYSSGGTVLTGNIINPNMDLNSATVAQAYFGAITATAATGAVRAASPLRNIRTAVSATVLDVVTETKIFNFGGVEQTLNGSITIANANNIPIQMPPVIIGPGQCALIYLWLNGATTPSAPSYAPEFGWWER